MSYICYNERKGVTMAERRSDEWNERQRAASKRVSDADEGGYAPTAIDLAMANGNFDLTPDGRESVYFGSMPPEVRPMGRRSVDGPQLPEK